MKSSLGNWLIQKVGKWLLKETSPKRPYLSDFNKVRQEVRPGDILLIETLSNKSHKAHGHTPQFTSVVYMMSRTPPHAFA